MGEEKSYIASDADVQGCSPAEVRHFAGLGRSLELKGTVKKRPRVVTLLARFPAIDFNH